MSQEVVEGDCAVEPVGCAGEVEELGASRRSESRRTTGVEGGCPRLVSVDLRAELELDGCSFISCGATEGVLWKHSVQRVSEMPLRQCLLQKCL